MLTDISKLALHYPCSRCNALPMQHCLTAPAKKRAPSPHAERWNMARDALREARNASYRELFRALGGEPVGRMLIQHGLDEVAGRRRVEPIQVQWGGLNPSKFPVAGRWVLEEPERSVLLDLDEYIVTLRDYGPLDGEWALHSYTPFRVRNTVNLALLRPTRPWRRASYAMIAPESVNLTTSRILSVTPQ